MIYLLLTVLCSTFIIVSFKLIGLRKVDEMQSITFNYVFAAAYGLLIWPDVVTGEQIIAKEWFLLAIITGVFFILVFFLFAISANKAGLTITAVASKMSVLIPVLAGFLIFNDSLYWIKVLGILLAVFSFVFIFKTNDKAKLSVKIILLPLLLFLGNGINDTLVKYTEHHYIKDDAHLYLFVVFATALILGASYTGAKMVIDKKVLSLKAFGFGFILGSFNFGSSYFMIKSMDYYQASVLFPVLNVSIVSLATLIGLFVFGERLRLVNWIGIFMAILAILLISWGL